MQRGITKNQSQKVEFSPKCHFFFFLFFLQITSQDREDITTELLVLQICGRLITPQNLFEHETRPNSRDDFFGWFLIAAMSEAFVVGRFCWVASETSRSFRGSAHYDSLLLFCQKWTATFKISRWLCKTKFCLHNPFVFEPASSVFLGNVRCIIGKVRVGIWSLDIIVSVPRYHAKDGCRVKKTKLNVLIWEDLIAACRRLELFTLHRRWEVSSLIHGTFVPSINAEFCGVMREFCQIRRVNSLLVL